MSKFNFLLLSEVEKNTQKNFLSENLNPEIIRLNLDYALAFLGMSSKILFDKSKTVVSLFSWFAGGSSSVFIVFCVEEMQPIFFLIASFTILFVGLLIESFIRISLIERLREKEHISIISMYLSNIGFPNLWISSSKYSSLKSCLFGFQIILTLLASSSSIFIWNVVETQTTCKYLLSLELDILKFFNFGWEFQISTIKIDVICVASFLISCLIFSFYFSLKNLHYKKMKRKLVEKRPHIMESILKCSFYHYSFN